MRRARIEVAVVATRPSCPTLKPAVEVGRPGGQADVAEPVDVHHGAVDPAGLGLGDLELEHLEDARGRGPCPASRGASPAARWAAAGANTSRPWNTAGDLRGADRRGIDLDRLGHAAERLPGERQQAVVGADERRPVGGRHRDRPAGRPDARVDDRQRRPRTARRAPCRWRASSRRPGCRGAGRRATGRRRARRGRSARSTRWHTPTNSSRRPRSETNTTGPLTRTSSTRHSPRRPTRAGGHRLPLA